MQVLWCNGIHMGTQFEVQPGLFYFPTLPRISLPLISCVLSHYSIKLQAHNAQKYKKMNVYLLFYFTNISVYTFMMRVISALMTDEHTLMNAPYTKSVYNNKRIMSQQGTD